MTGNDEGKRGEPGGRLVVQYKCPECEAKLKSRIDEVGYSIICPVCEISFYVPDHDYQNDSERQQEGRLVESDSRRAQKMNEAYGQFNHGRKYETATLISAIYSIAGVLLGGILAISGVVSFSLLLSQAKFTEGLMVGGSLLLSGGMTWAGFCYAAEMMKVVVDIQQNTSVTANACAMIAKNGLEEKNTAETQRGQDSLMR